MEAAITILIVLLITIVVGCLALIFDQEGEIRRLRAAIKPFDGDGDGRPGGSVRR